MRLAIDTGGTFTDLVVEDDEGLLSVYKRPTTPRDPVAGILDVVGATADGLGMTCSELLAHTTTVVHATTHALNALLTGDTARTVLIVTEGHRDVLLLREGGREHFNVRASYPDPYVPRALTFEVTERIAQNGDVVVPLDEQHVREVVRAVGDSGAEAIAVCLLWSIVNPAHELVIGTVVAGLLPGVPFTLSHALSPSLREYRRASASAIDASLKPRMGRYLSGLSDRLRQAGFAGRLLMVTSSGALLDMDEVAGAPIHSIKSGPAMAPVAGRVLAAAETGSDSAIVADTGGTSYDVSAVRRSTIPWTRETWLGTPYLSHFVGFPSVDVRSYGAGGGSVAWVDRGGLLHVGPQSAGADPGPVAYGRGGIEPTFTDAALVLRHLDPGDFLGGAIPLDPDAAERAIGERVGKPLELKAVEAAAAIAEVMAEQMTRAIEDMALRQGLDPSTAIFIGGGGAAGLNAVTVARRVGCSHVLIPSVSAALSAAGALLSDIAKDFAITRPMRLSAADIAAAADIVEELRARGEAFLAGLSGDTGESDIAFSVEAHYVREVWEIEVPLEVPFNELSLAGLREAFNTRHDELYAVTDGDADVEIISWRARAWSSTVGRLETVGRPERAAAAATTRRAFFPDVGWASTTVLALESLASGASIEGPAIVTSAVTTTVVEPGAHASVTPTGGLLIELRTPAPNGTLLGEFHRSV